MNYISDKRLNFGRKANAKPSKLTITRVITDVNDCLEFVIPKGTKKLRIYRDGGGDPWFLSLYQFIGGVNNNLSIRFTGTTVWESPDISCFDNDKLYIYGTDNPPGGSVFVFEVWQ